MISQLLPSLFVLFTALSCAYASTYLVDKSARTIIVGAGISGLSAAAHLEENDYEDYIIVEATGRVGGRIKTLMQEQDGIKYPLEIGAGWIHGSENNPVYDIAELHGLLEPNEWTNEEKNPRFYEYKKEFRLGDGTVIPRAIWQPVNRFYNTATDRADAFYSRGMPAGYQPMSSVESYILDQFYKEFNGSSPARWMKERSVLETLLSYETWSDGCNSMKEVSLKYIGAYETLEGEDITLPKGYETVIKAIKDTIPANKIKLNHVVDKIEYSRDNSLVKVKCKNGQIFEADNVIVTSSLGFLKNNAATMFDPPLPEKKMAAIRRMGFGTADRIYLEFNNLDFISDREVAELFFVRKPEELQDPTNWLNKVFTCYVQDVPKANMLTCWLTGKQAEEMEGRSDQEVASKMRGLLQQFLGRSVPAPLKMIRSKWNSEEFTKGVYSFIKVGSSIDDVYTLAESIYAKDNSSPIVMFAGEATHDEFYSTTHGAYLSGIREAEKLAESGAKKAVMRKRAAALFSVLKKLRF